MDENAENEIQIKELQALLRNSESSEMRKFYRRQIKQLRQVNQETIRAKRTELEAIRQTYTASNWNASMLDIAYGKVFSYDRANIDSLGMVNQGYGLWLNGGNKKWKKWLHQWHRQVLKIWRSRCFSSWVKCQIWKP